MVPQKEGDHVCYTAPSYFEEYSECGSWCIYTVRRQLCHRTWNVIDRCCRVMQIQTLSNQSTALTGTIQIDLAQSTLRNINVARSLDSYAASRADARGGVHHRSLMHAIKAGDCDLVEKLLDQDADAQTHEDGTAPLIHKAIENENVQTREDMVTLLVSRGVDINAISNEGETVLYKAVRTGLRSGDLTLISSLLRHGADANVRASTGTTALLLAMRDCVRIPINFNFHGEWEPECEYVGPRFRIIKILVEFGADIRVCDQTGTGPVLFAVMWGMLETFDLLRRYGADTRCVLQPVEGHAILQREGNADFLRDVICKYKTQIESVSTRREHGDENRDGAEVEVDHKDESSSEDEEDEEDETTITERNGKEIFTLAILAVVCDERELLEHLLTTIRVPYSALGFVRWIQSYMLRAAARTGNLEVIRLLLLHRMGDSIKAMLQTGVLQEACRWGHLHVVAELVELGASPLGKQPSREQRSSTQSPLYSTMFAGRSIITEWLLDLAQNRGLELDPWIELCHLMEDDCLQDPDNRRAIVVSLLARHDANVLDCNEEGKTLLHMAARAGSLRTCETLISIAWSQQAKSYQDLWDQKNQSAVSMAVRSALNLIDEGRKALAARLNVVEVSDAELRNHTIKEDEERCKLIEVHAQLIHRLLTAFHRRSEQDGFRALKFKGSNIKWVNSDLDKLPDQIVFLETFTRGNRHGAV